MRMALLKPLLANFALYILVNVLHTNLLVGINPDPLCSVLQGSIKVGDENMWALD